MSFLFEKILVSNFYFSIFLLSSTREYFLALDVERRINVIGRYRETEASRVLSLLSNVYMPQTLFLTHPIYLRESRFMELSVCTCVHSFVLHIAH